MRRGRGRLAIARLATADNLVKAQSDGDSGAGRSIVSDLPDVIPPALFSSKGGGVGLAFVSHARAMNRCVDIGGSWPTFDQANGLVGDVGQREQQ